jgi:hypothetical protein
MGFGSGQDRPGGMARGFGRRGFTLSITLSINQRICKKRSVGVGDGEGGPGMDYGLCQKFDIKTSM